MDKQSQKAEIKVSRITELVEQAEAQVAEVQKASSLADDIFGASVKQWRDLRGLTQEAVTASMVERGFEFHQSTLYKIENGKRRTLLGEGIALAEILDVPLSQLTSPEVASEPSLLASLKFGARLEIEAIKRAQLELIQIQKNALSLLTAVGALEEETGDKLFEFNGAQATARDFYEPLLMPGIKPALEQITKLLKESEAIERNVYA